MRERLTVDGWSLERATDGDVDTLMLWFPDKHSIHVWGGPRFRYPFNRESFIEDCRWHEMATFTLRDPNSQFTAFGQFYERNGRINLARLVANPQMRGQGIGKRLVKMLMTAGAAVFPLEEYSLYVYKDNMLAIKCYLSLGFESQDSSPDGAMADVCHYMTRSVDR